MIAVYTEGRHIMIGAADQHINFTTREAAKLQLNARELEQLISALEEVKTAIHVVKELETTNKKLHEFEPNEQDSLNVLYRTSNIIIE